MDFYNFLKIAVQLQNTPDNYTHYFVGFAINFLIKLLITFNTHQNVVTGSLTNMTFVKYVPQIYFSYYTLGILYSKLLKRITILSILHLTIILFASGIYGHTSLYNRKEINLSIKYL